jgi:hypothetical protein
MNIAWRVMRRDRSQMLSCMNLRITGVAALESTSRFETWRLNRFLHLKDIMKFNILLLVATLAATPAAAAQGNNPPPDAPKSVIKIVIGASVLAVGAVVIAKSSQTTSTTSALGMSETSSFSTTQLVTGIVIAGAGGIVLWDALREHPRRAPSTTVGIAVGKGIDGVFVRRAW